MEITCENCGATTDKFGVTYRVEDRGDGKGPERKRRVLCRACIREVVQENEENPAEDQNRQ